MQVQVFKLNQMFSSSHIPKYLSKHDEFSDLHEAIIHRQIKMEFENN